jgi:hypothetical protein
VTRVQRIVRSEALRQARWHSDAGSICQLRFWVGQMHRGNSGSRINAAGGGPSDRAKMMDVFRRHGMTLAAPPHVKYRPFVSPVFRTVLALNRKRRLIQEDSRDSR